MWSILLMGVQPCADTTLTQVTPTQFLESINLINEVLISAHSLRLSFVDNMLAVFTLQVSRLVLTSHYEKVNIDQPVWSDVDLNACHAGNTKIAEDHHRLERRAVQPCWIEYIMAT